MTTIDSIKSKETEKKNELSKFENMAWKRNAARRKSNTKPVTDSSPEQERELDTCLKQETHSSVKKSSAPSKSQKPSSIVDDDHKSSEMENDSEINISELIIELGFQFVVHVKDSWFWPDETEHHSKTEPSQTFVFKNIPPEHPAAQSFYLHNRTNENATGGSVLNPDVPAFVPVLVEEAVVSKRRPGFCLNRNRQKIESIKHEPIPIYNLFQENQNRTMMRDVDRILDILDVERIENINLNSTQELSPASTGKMKDACSLPPAISVPIPTAKVQPSVVTHQTALAEEVPRELEIMHHLLSSTGRQEIMNPNCTTQIPEIPSNNLEPNIYSIGNAGIPGSQNQTICPNPQSIFVDQQSATVQMDHGRSFVEEQFLLNQLSAPPRHTALIESQSGSNAIRPPPGLTLPAQEQIPPVRIANNPLPVYNFLKDHSIPTANYQPPVSHSCKNSSTPNYPGTALSSELETPQRYLNSVVDQQTLKTEVTSKPNQPEDYILSQEGIPMGNNHLVSDAEAYSTSMIQRQNNIERKTKLLLNNEWPISQPANVNSVSQKLNNTQKFNVNDSLAFLQLLDAKLRTTAQKDSENPNFLNNSQPFSHSLNENPNLKERDDQKPILLGSSSQAALQSCDIKREFNTFQQTIQPENSNWPMPQVVDEASIDAVGEEQNTRTVLPMNRSWASSPSFNINLGINNQSDTQRNVSSVNDQWPASQSQNISSMVREQANFTRANFPVNSQRYPSQPTAMYSNVQEQSLRQNVTNNWRTSEHLNSIVQDRSNIPLVADQRPTSQLQNTNSAGVLHNNPVPNIQPYYTNDAVQGLNSLGNTSFVQSHDNSLKREQSFPFIPNRQPSQLPQNGCEMNPHEEEQLIHWQSVCIIEDSSESIPIRGILRNPISNEACQSKTNNKRVTFVQNEFCC